MTYIIGRGGPTDKQALRLDSRKGNHIANERKPERLPSAMAEAVKFIEGGFPGARCVSATAVYNCAGLVFGNRRTFVDSDVTDWLLREDDFERLSDASKWRVGDVVVYRKNNTVTHVGLIYALTPKVTEAELDVIVLSAWGSDGEYVHPWRVVHPLLGTPVEVWSQRKVIS